MALGIKYGVTGQSLSHIPMGLASSVTYSIEDLSQPYDGADRILGSGAATVASWSTTTDAAAGRSQANPKRIPVTSTAGMSIGDPAVLIDLDGTFELVEIAGLRSNDYVEITSALGGSYETGATFAGVKISASFPDLKATDLDWFRERRPMRIVWTYTVNGVKRIIPEPIEFVRADASLNLGEVVRRFKLLYPDLTGRQVDDSNGLESMAQAIADTFVIPDLKARNIEPDRFLMGDQGTTLVILRLYHHFVTMGIASGSGTPDTAATWKDYTRQLETLTIGLPGVGVFEPNKVTDQTSEDPSKKYRPPSLRM